MNVPPSVFRCLVKLARIGCGRIQLALRSAQEAAKAKADATVAEIKAAPGNLQRQAVKSLQAGVDEVSPDGI